MRRLSRLPLKANSTLELLMLLEYLFYDLFILWYISEFSRKFRTNGATKENQRLSWAIRWLKVNKGPDTRCNIACNIACNGVNTWCNCCVKCCRSRTCFYSCHIARNIARNVSSCVRSLTNTLLGSFLFSPLSKSIFIPSCLWNDLSRIKKQDSLFSYNYYIYVI